MPNTIPPVPFHIVPHAASADRYRVLKDGGKAAESAPVYVLRDELVRFTKWLSGAIPDLQQKPRAKHKRDVEADAARKNLIERVLAKARRIWPDPKKRPEIDVMAKELERLHRKELGYRFEAIRKILKGTYSVSVRLGIPGL